MKKRDENKAYVCKNIRVIQSDPTETKFPERRDRWPKFWKHPDFFAWPPFQSLTHLIPFIFPIYTGFLKALQYLVLIIEKFCCIWSLYGQRWFSRPSSFNIRTDPFFHETENTASYELIYHKSHMKYRDFYKYIFVI